MYGGANAIYRVGLIAPATITDTGNRQTQFMPKSVKSEGAGKFVTSPLHHEAAM